MSTDRVTPLAVAGRLYAHGYTAATLPHDEPALAYLISRAFAGERLSDLPASKSDFRAIRQHLDMLGRAEEQAA